MSRSAPHGTAPHLLPSQAREADTRSAGPSQLGKLLDVPQASRKGWKPSSPWL